MPNASMALVGSKIRCIRGACNELDLILSSSTGDCDPEPEKALPPPATQLEELCRISARLQYLIDLVGCGSNQRCCEQAYQEYCDALDACGGN